MQFCEVNDHKLMKKIHHCFTWSKDTSGPSIMTLMINYKILRSIPQEWNDLPKSCL